jgi:hypothetical protein
MLNSGSRDILRKNMVPILANATILIKSNSLNFLAITSICFLINNSCFIKRVFFLVLERDDWMSNLLKILL